MKPAEFTFEYKICAPENLSTPPQKLPHPIVFTNGVFDILHRGHVCFLAQARQLGASLAVALNTDASVRKLGKGGDRPVNTLDDRAAVIAALAAVDIVTWFDTDTPYNLIVACRPDILVKGGDWGVDSIVGANDVIGWGGQVYSLPFVYERSTTATLAKIRGTKQ